MKTTFTIFILALLSMATISSCKKDSPKPSPVYGCMDPHSSSYNPAATVDNGSCIYTGRANFWFNSNLGSDGTVNINGQSGSITIFYSTYQPTCGSPGCATFTLPTGTYTYFAYNTLHNWNGSVTIDKDGCEMVLLK